MAGAGKSFRFFLALSIVFFLLTTSGMCNDVEELNQGLIKENVTISYNHTFPFLTALFGGPLVKGIEYHVSVASPNRKACCGPIDPPAKDNLTAEFWIVVIERKDCFFVQKIRNAQDAGYHAAIIHNIGSNDLVRMGDDYAADIHIPAFFIGQDDGVNLINEYFKARKQGQTLLLSMETNGYEPNYEYIIHLRLLPSYLVMTVTFGLAFGFLIFLLVKVVKSCSILRQKKRSAGLGQLSNSLATIPTKTFESGDPFETCSICTEDYVKGDKLRLLHCSHAFHCVCIDHWLAHHRRMCPLCNQRVESQLTSVV